MSEPGTKRGDGGPRSTLVPAPVRAAAPVVGLVLLLFAYLVAAVVGAVRPGWFWLLVLAAALFLVTVVGAAVLAARRT